MKGGTEKSVGLTITVILAVAVVGVGIYILMTQVAPVNLLDIILNVGQLDLFGGEPGYDIWEPGTGELEEKQEEKITSQFYDYYTPSEIGCYLSGYIYNDFTLRDHSTPFHKEEVFCSGGGGYGYTCLINYITDVKIGNIPSEDGSKLEEENCKLCEPNLDEVCINLQLSVSPEVGDQPFCGEWYFERGTSNVKFGNKDYFRNTSNNWPSGYEDYCKIGDEDRIYQWRADVRDDPEIYTDSVSTKTPLQDETTPYVAVVIWKSNEHKYAIRFRRIPLQIEKELSGDEVWGIINKTFCENEDCGEQDPSDEFRTNTIGLFDYVKAREVLDYNVTLTTELNLFNIKKTLDDLEGDTWDLEGEYKNCISEEDCLQSRLEHDERIGGCRLHTQARDKVENDKNIIIVSTAENANVVLQPGKYRFIIRKWYDMYDHWYDWISANCKYAWEKSIIIYEYPEEAGAPGDECTSNADCPDYCDGDTIIHTDCIDNICQETGGSRDCASDETCENGRCVGDECESDNDCPENFCTAQTRSYYECHSGYCVINYEQCEGQSYCDGTQYLHNFGCSNGECTETVIDCIANGKICEETTYGAECTTL